MISAFDKTFKLGVLLSVIDWFTFNVVFVLFSLLGWLGKSEEFAVGLLVANIAYLIALQIVTISLHHRQAQPAKVLSNTSRTSVIFIVLYCCLFRYGRLFGTRLLPSIVVAFIVFLATSIERLMLRTYIKHKRSVGKNRVNTIILGTGQKWSRKLLM